MKIDSIIHLTIKHITRNINTETLTNTVRKDTQNEKPSMF